MRTLAIIFTLFLASCGADSNNGTSTDVTISLGQSIASGAIGAQGSIPDSVQSVSITAINNKGKIITGPVFANKPNFTLTIRVPNGKNIRFLIRAYSSANGQGSVLYETTTEPVDLEGKPIAVPVKMNLAIAVTTNNATTGLGGTIDLYGTVSGNSPTEFSTLSWDSPSGTFGTPSTFGGHITWTAPLSAGTYIITTRVDNPSQDADAVGTIEITVTESLDTVAPVITAPAALTVEATGTFTPVALVVASATDLVDGVTAVSNDAPATFPLGATTVTYSSTDAAGNTSTATQVVTIVDTTAPIITLTGLADIYVEVNTAYTEQGATWADNLDGTGAATVTGTVNTTVLGTYTLNYNVTDAAGNVATTVLRNVIVQDTIAPTSPTMTSPNTPSTTFTTVTFAGFAEAGSTVDIYSGAIHLASTISNPDASFAIDVSGLAVAAHTFSIFATDAAGNQSTATTITLTVNTSTAVAGDANIHVQNQVGNAVSGMRVRIYDLLNRTYTTAGLTDAYGDITYNSANPHAIMVEHPTVAHLSGFWNGDIYAQPGLPHVPHLTTLNQMGSYLAPPVASNKIDLVVVTDSVNVAYVSGTVVGSTALTPVALANTRVDLVPVGQATSMTSTDTNTRSNLYTFTDATGAFAIGAPLGDYYTLVGVSQINQASYAEVAVNGGWLAGFSSTTPGANALPTANSAQLLNMTAAGAYSADQTALVQGATLSGTLVDQASAPIPFASVSIDLAPTSVGGNVPIGQVSTDVNGVFSQNIPLTLGTNNVFTVQSNGYYYDEVNHAFLPLPNALVGGFVQALPPLIQDSGQANIFSSLSPLVTPNLQHASGALIQGVVNDPYGVPINGNALVFIKEINNLVLPFFAFPIVNGGKVGDPYTGYYGANVLPEKTIGAALFSRDYQVKVESFNSPLFDLYGWSGGYIDQLGNTVIKPWTAKTINLVPPSLPVFDTYTANATLGGGIQGVKTLLAGIPLNAGGSVVDVYGNTFITDVTNNQIVKVLPDGTLAVVAGSPGGTAGTLDGAIISATFTSPSAITIDQYGSLYVADANALRKIDLTTGQVTTFGTQTLVTNFLLNPATPTNISASDLVINDIGDLVVSDLYTATPSLKRITLGSDGPPVLISNLTTPKGITSDASNGFFGVTYVIDSDAGVNVPVIDRYDFTVTRVYTGASPATSIKPLENPIDIAVDSAGNLFVLDNVIGGNKLYKISTLGTITLLATFTSTLATDSIAINNEATAIHVISGGTGQLFIIQ